MLGKAICGMKVRCAPGPEQPIGGLRPDQLPLRSGSGLLICGGVLAAMGRGLL
jgi:hypothetical protein